MKLNFLITILLSFIIHSYFSQNDEDFIVQSLDFFDERFHLNLKKMNEPIIVIYNDKTFLCTEYTNNNINRIEDVRFSLELKKSSENEYNFILNVVTECKGAFNIKIVDDRIKIYNLYFMEKSD